MIIISYFLDVAHLVLAFLQDRHYHDCVGFPSWKEYHEALAAVLNRGSAGATKDGFRISEKTS
jgi:hypothetical protein